MNEFDYDVMQKKRVAASARKRVCGSKSKKCSLPSDHMTQKEIQAMNGDVKTWRINDPMSYGAFKRMPDDLQQQYIDGLQSRFSVGITTISRDLFHMSDSTLAYYMKYKGLKGRPGNKMSTKDRKTWENWLGRLEDAPCEEAGRNEDASVESVPCKTADVEAPVEHETAFAISDLSASFSGRFDEKQFLRWVTMLPIPDGNVKIRVEITAVNA